MRGFSVGIKSVFLISFGNVGSLEMVGLNISLRFIFKPSYSPHCINIDVGCNATEKIITKEHIKERLNKMKKLILLNVALVLTISLMAQESDSTNQTLDEAAIKNAVENFLTAAGNYNIEAISTMFTLKANISGASFRNEKWNSYTMTIEEFIAALKSDPNPKKYKEPVDNWTIHIDGGQLAFVRADATLITDGKPKSHNIDYFTLVKENADWKILNGSYVSIPIQDKSK